jgi:hypothetical protein
MAKQKSGNWQVVIAKIKANIYIAESVKETAIKEIERMSKLPSNSGLNFNHSQTKLINLFELRASPFGTDFWMAIDLKLKDF